MVNLYHRRTPRPPPGLTRSTMEVADYRYFVSERRSSSTPNRRNTNLDLKKQKTVCRFGPWEYSPRWILIFADVSFRMMYVAP